MKPYIGVATSVDDVGGGALEDLGAMALDMATEARVREASADASAKHAAKADACFGECFEAPKGGAS